MMFSNCGAEGSWESARRWNQSILKETNPAYSLEYWLEYSLEYWSWSSNTLATWSEELTHWKRPWCSAGGEGGNRGWDGWMASSTQQTCLWANSGRQWRTGKLACCSPWGQHKELDTTWWLNNNNIYLKDTGRYILLDSAVKNTDDPHSPHLYSPSSGSKYIWIFFWGGSVSHYLNSHYSHLKLRN